MVLTNNKEKNILKEGFFIKIYKQDRIRALNFIPDLKDYMAYNCHNNIVIKMEGGKIWLCDNKRKKDITARYDYMFDMEVTNLPELFEQTKKYYEQYILDKKEEEEKEIEEGGFYNV